MSTFVFESASHCVTLLYSILQKQRLHCTLSCQADLVDLCPLGGPYPSSIWPQASDVGLFFSLTDKDCRMLQNFTLAS